MQTFMQMYKDRYNTLPMNSRYIGRGRFKRYGMRRVPLEKFNLHRATTIKTFLQNRAIITWYVSNEWESMGLPFFCDNFILIHDHDEKMYLLSGNALTAGVLYDQLKNTIAVKRKKETGESIYESIYCAEPHYLLI